MADAIRYHIDESADPDIAAALRRIGIDVTTTQEVGLRTSLDPMQWEYARREGRVIVTHDADFLRLAKADSDHPGVAYCHQQARTIGELIDMLILLQAVSTPDQMRGCVEYL
jgi:predicted nuclease of predicted toxin-antitoxin system